MIRELMIGLVLTQTIVCHSYAKTWLKSLQDLHQWRLAILRQPNQAYRQYCQTLPADLRIEFRSEGGWQDICQNGEEYRHRGRRYWRLIVSCKYEILGRAPQSIELEFELFR